MSKVYFHFDIIEKVYTPIVYISFKRNKWTIDLSMWRRSISRQDININGRVGEPAYSHDEIGCYYVVFLVVSLEFLSLSLSLSLSQQKG